MLHFECMHTCDVFSSLWSVGKELSKGMAVLWIVVGPIVDIREFTELLILIDID